MEQKIEAKEYPSKILLTNQNSLSISGVSKVLSNTENCISLMLNNQILNIEGEKLSVSKLDIENKILEATGLVTDIKFNKSKQKENFIKRIFG